MQRLVVITMKDNGEKIDLKCGDIFQIELEGLGSAGYWWYFDSLKTEHFELLSEETRSISENKTGAQVLGVWRLRAKREGYTEIRMSQYRVWEGIEKSIGHFFIKVDIKKSE